MNTVTTIALLFTFLFIAGCATGSTASQPTDEASQMGDSSVGDSSGNGTAPQAKTAYEGSTGSGLIMQRYKSGNIDGYRE